MILDEAKFHVQAHVLIDMARRVVRLSPENGADFKDAGKHAHHDLLVELWALRQKCVAAKIFQLKHVRPALRGRGYQLG